MNDNLKNYTEQPDPKVWEGINDTLHRRSVMRRRLLWGSAAAVAVMVGGIAVATLAQQDSHTTEQYAQLQMPQEEVSTTAPAAQPPAAAPVVADKGLTVKAAPARTPRQEAEEAPEAAPVARQEAAEPVAAPVAAQPAVTPRVSAMPQERAGNPQPAATTVAEAPKQAPANMEEQEQHLPDMPEEKVVQSAGVSNEPDMLLWFPNVFAPHSDNEALNRFCAQINVDGATINNFRMAVYNRAGARVFFSNDINTCWDGTRQGQPLPQAAYVYTVFYTDKDGVQHHCKGTVTLIR